MMSSIKRFSGRPRKNPNSIGVKKDEYIAHDNMNFIHARYHLQCPSTSSASNNLVFFHYLGLSINVLSERVNCNIQHRVENSSVWKYEARHGLALFQLTSISWTWMESVAFSYCVGRGSYWPRQYIFMHLITSMLCFIKCISIRAKKHWR